MTDEQRKCNECGYYDHARCWCALHDILMMPEDYCSKAIEPSEEDDGD